MAASWLDWSRPLEVLPLANLSDAVRGSRRIYSDIRSACISCSRAETSGLRDSSTHTAGRFVGRCSSWVCAPVCEPDKIITDANHIRECEYVPGATKCL